VLIHIERDGTHASVTAASIALTNLGQIDDWFLWSPGIGADRNLHAEAAFAESDAVDRFRMEVVGNELVVSLEILVSDVEENSPVFAFGTLPENLDRDCVAFKEWG
jgi:orotidine-5'-phosphate decarboxylase